MLHISEILSAFSDKQRNVFYVSLFRCMKSTNATLSTAIENQGAIKCDEINAMKNNKQRVHKEFFFSFV